MPLFRGAIKSTDSRTQALASFCVHREWSTQKERKTRTKCWMTGLWGGPCATWKLDERRPDETTGICLKNHVRGPCRQLTSCSDKFPIQSSSRSCLQRRWGLLNKILEWPKQFRQCVDIYRCRRIHILDWPKPMPRVEMLGHSLAPQGPNPLLPWLKTTAPPPFLSSGDRQICFHVKAAFGIKKTRFCNMMEALLCCKCTST